MLSVKISSKGKALLRNKKLSSALIHEIIRNGDKLYTEEGIIVTVDGKTIVAKAAPVSSNNGK
jgi:hypothetical protein